MPGLWTITYDNGSGPVEQSAAAWGLTAAPKIRTRDRSPTEFHFRMAGASPEGGVPFPFKSKVIIKQNRTYASGAWGGSGYIFTGYQTTQVGAVNGNKQGIQLVFKDAIWLLQNTTFQQLWQQASSPSNPWLVSRCVLFMNISGWLPNTFQSVSWEINEIITYAVSCGISIAAGTIDYSGWYLNYYHCQAVSCWDALLKCLAPIADAKVWVDGSTSTPTLNVRTRAAIAALPPPTSTAPGPITLPYRGIDAAGRHHFSSKGFTPRYDLQPPQVVLQYQINNTFNSKPAPSWTNDVYPATVGGLSDGQMPFAMVCPIDLKGSHVTSETGTLDCEALACVGGNHSTKRLWWAAKRGGEQDKLADFRVRFGANTLVDATVIDDNGAPINLTTYPNRIVQGSYHAWMKSGTTQIIAIRAHIKVMAQFAEYDVVGSTPAETDTNGNLTHKSTAHELHCHVTLTNAPINSNTFVGSQLTAQSESPAPNLALNIYNSRAILDYDGTHEIVDPGLPNAGTPPLAQLIGHWNVLNFSGNASPWATANMTISGTEIDLMTNHVTIQVGPSKHLQPQDWSSMLQFFRYRWLFGASSERATGLRDANNNVDMPLNTPDANTVPGLVVDSFNALIGADMVDPTRTNVIKQDATGTQITVFQQNTSNNTVYTSGVIAPEYSGAGAPATATLAANAYYRAGDKYWNTSVSPPDFWRCNTAGTNSTSVWDNISGCIP